MSTSPPEIRVMEISGHAHASSSNSNFHQPPPQTPDRSEKEQLWKCLPLYRAVQRGDYCAFTREAQLLWPGLGSFEAISRSMSMKITGNGDTALHVLVGSGSLKDARYGKWFSSLKHDFYIDSSLLTVRNRDGHTPLCIAAMVGNLEAAEFFLGRNPLLGALDDTVGPYPIIEATRYGHKPMVLLLIGEMARKMKGAPPTKQSTASLFLHLLVEAGFYDVLLALVRRHPGLARAEFYGDDGESLLSLMAGKPSAFPSGTQLIFWERLLYSVVPSMLERNLAHIEKFLTVGQSSTAIPMPAREELPAEPKHWLTWECLVRHTPRCVLLIGSLIEICVDHIYSLINRCMDHVGFWFTGFWNIINRTKIRIFHVVDEIREIVL